MIVGLCGKKFAGKDTAGDYLVERYGFTRLSFADPLKLSAAECWGVNPALWNEWKNNPYVKVEIVERPHTIHASISAREFLQRFGTEAHRGVFGDNFWVENVTMQLDEAPLAQNFVITDARFENEILALKKQDGWIVYIDRPGVDTADMHASETSTPEDLIDITILNDSTVEHLYGLLDLLVAGAVHA